MYLRLYVCVCAYIVFGCEMMVLMRRVVLVGFFLILLLEKLLSLLIF